MTSSSVEDSNKGKVIYATAVIKVAYDGTYFRGWKATNNYLDAGGDNIDHDNDDVDDDANDDKALIRIQQLENRIQSRRSRVLQRKGGLYGKENRIRTVEDTIRSTLMKIYGDVNANQILIDGCSRTDAGVHAKSQIAQFWCTRDEDYYTPVQSPSRPMSRNDTSNFRPLPFNSDLSKLVFVMNRMLPPDVRVLAASPLPQSSLSSPISSSTTTNDEAVPFHPTLHALGKTYAYRFAIGPMHDPLNIQYVWHLDGSSRRGVGMSGKRFNMERALAAANLFVNSNDTNINMSNAVPRDYGAFRAAFKGTDRGRVQSTICKLWECRIVPERAEILPSWQQGDEGVTGRLDKATFESFTVVISGDRFLYKMVRNIVGTIIAVACGHVEIEEVRIALDTGKWRDKVTRICAPARGLTLHHVYYPPDHEFQWQNG
jgi:tRNA U38,U39,U40 pseudouridine synthase TruA